MSLLLLFCSFFLSSFFNFWFSTVIFIHKGFFVFAFKIIEEIRRRRCLILHLLLFLFLFVDLQKLKFPAYFLLFFFSSSWPRNICICRLSTLMGDDKRRVLYFYIQFWRLVHILNEDFMGSEEWQCEEGKVTKGGAWREGRAGDGSGRFEPMTTIPRTFVGIESELWSILL